MWAPVKAGRCAMTSFARDLIARIRYGDYTREDVLKLCAELQARLDKKPDLPKKPHRDLWRVNKKKYYQQYMRWWHKCGPVGAEGRET